MTMNCKIYAPAKLNLTLRMLDKREDGYSNLNSLTVFLPELFDVLKIVDKPNPGLSLNNESKHLVEADENNLIVKAFEKYSKHERIAELFPEVKDLHIELTKNLPITAGIGGGSADCAATLNLLNMYCDNELTVTELLWLAEELGSDVPACIYSQALWMKGRGEIVEPLDELYLPDIKVLVVTPNIECSTPRIYNHYHEMGRPTDVGIDAPAEMVEYCENLHNDLALSAFDLFEDLVEFKSAIESETGLQFMLAGSGSTLYTISDAESIENNKVAISQSSLSRNTRLIASSEII